MEKGDPSVAIGIYATALWLMGRASELETLADPAFDLDALQASVQAAQKRSVRKAVSVQNRLQNAPLLQRKNKTPE